MATDIYTENKELRGRLTSILTQARENEAKMRRFNEQEFKAIGTTSLAELVRLVLYEYKEAFELDDISLILLDPEYELSRILDECGIPVRQTPELILEPASERLKAIFPGDYTPLLGPFDSGQYGYLFAKQGGTLGSVALLPLARQGKLIGSLDLGSRDSERFTAGAATDFLERLGAIVAVCLENTVNHERLKRVGLTDPLTRVNNRRFFEQRLSEEVATARRHAQSLACMFLDIDHFKRINDTLGHQAGDTVLREVAMLISSQLRHSDTVCRYGGEEFVVLLPQTRAAEGVEIAERVRRVVANYAFRMASGTAISITISIGVSVLPAPESELEPDASGNALVAAADQALYQAKADGRNRVVLAGAEKPQAQQSA